MKSITYIKRNLTNLNRSILSQLLQSEGVELTDGLWNYLIETPWNLNTAILRTEFGVDIDENSEDNADCNHPELGTLIYCGSASDKIIVTLDGCDDGVQEEWCDVEKWRSIIYSGVGTHVCATGVFDGNIVSAEGLSENSIGFGTYLEVAQETDPETGDWIIRVSELQGASHYAIYSNPITEEQV